MYLDPGSTGLFIQGLFAAIATALAMFARTRTWFVGLWHRVVNVVRRRPPKA